MDTLPISVLMPVFNSQRYIRRCVDSILSQTFGEYEFIIIDDGSTDSTKSILEGYARRESRIKLISRARTGYSRALNEALSLASGEFLARMDSDDVARPRRFERQIEYLRGDQDCVAVGCRVLKIDPSGIPLYETHNETDHEKILGVLLKGFGAEIPHPGVMMRRVPVVALGGYRVEFEPVEDLDLYLRLADRGKLANLPDILLEYRQHFASVNYLHYAKQIRLASLVVAEALIRRGQHVPDDFSVAGWVMPTKHERYRSWVKPAVRSGRIDVAIKYALYSLISMPKSIDSFRALISILRSNLGSILNSSRRVKTGD